MKKRKIAIVFAICCIFTVLCACGRKTSIWENGVEKKQKSGMDKESRKEPVLVREGEESASVQGEVESASVQDGEQSAERDLSSLEDWKLAYLSYLDGLEVKDSCTYTFLYVDDDEIPELVIDSGYEAGGCLILT